VTPPLVEDEKGRAERARRGKRRREGSPAQVLGRIELPARDAVVRDYGPHVRIKERREEGDKDRRGRARVRPPRRPRVRERSVAPKPIIERPTQIALDYPVTLRTLSEAAGIKVDALMRTLVAHNKLCTINDPLSPDILTLLSTEFGVGIEVKRGRDFEGEVRAAAEQPGRPEDLQLRPPVVTFLGHVDHGKTSLLDAIRQTHVAAGESGGITQHIGAYTVEQGGHKVCFLDTPGHEAFTAMRARGAQVTDIAVLVVAADDGVMPQTEEALNHAKAAGVAIVVAMNKIDLPTARPQRVMQQFSSLGVLPSKWGGDIEFVEVSALTKQGLSDLIDTLAIQAEILELKADPKRPASGYVLEAHLDPGRGSVATILVQDGTLHRGDIVLAGAAYGRARQLLDDRGRSLDEAGPSSPVEIAGLSAVPSAGDAFVVLPTLDQARGIADDRARKVREASVAERKHVTLENLFATLDKAEVRVLRVILKADVQGSLEVLKKSLNDLATKEVAVQFLHAAVGGINESDVLLAEASEAVIIGFHVVADPPARMLAEDRKVDIRLYNVIYHLTDDVKAALESKLEPERRETVLGHASVRHVFRITRVGMVAGCLVTDGKITRSARVRLIRDSVVVFQGLLGSLRRVKDDAREVATNTECGIRIADYDDVKEGDVIEAYEITEIKRTL
jgi:translation initiation factor IF-2